MLKKWKLIVYVTCLVFLKGECTASLGEYEVDENSTKLSFFGPTNRGFNRIESASFSGVEEGPSDEHFSLADHPTSFLIDVGDGPIGDPSIVNSPIKKSSLMFSTNTTYGTVCPAGSRCYFGGLHPIDKRLQSAIKTRVSTFAIARLTFDSFDVVCKSLGISSRLNKLNVSLNPHDQGCILGIGNAYYERKNRGGKGSIQFCSKAIGTAEIFDVTSHEVGHAALDALNTIFYGHGPNHPFSAFHEVFGDLSSFYATVRLARLSGRTYMIPDLLRDEESVCFAPGLSGEGSCLLRDKSHGNCEAHANSTHFRSFFLSSMNSVFAGINDPTGLVTIDFFQKLLVYTAINTTGFNSLYTLGKQMIHNVPLLCGNRHASAFITKKMQEELGSRFINLNYCKAS